MSKANILQFLLRRKPAQQDADDLKSVDPERRAQAMFRLGRTRMRSGDMRAAIELFDRAIALLPDYAEAVAARAESLDMLGKVGDAQPQYEKARRLWAEQHAGAPDRSYLYRQHGRFTFEVDSYELALQRIKTGAFPHLAVGNALLVQGRAEEALQHYERALKLKRGSPDLVALKGEALSMMGQYGPAIEALDLALAAIPNSPEILSARAIAKSAQGKLEEANADWRRQLDLLGPEQSAARAYVALRLADYGTALGEIDRALARTPKDAYLVLYRRTALLRLGKSLDDHAQPMSGDPWPAPLFALQAGECSLDEALKQATTRGRRAETIFQFAAFSAAKDLPTASKLWREVVDKAPPALVEYGAARNELARLGS